jgi:hypothetical protein
MAEANVRRRGVGSPERRGGEIPIAHAIGLPGERASGDGSQPGFTPVISSVMW